MDEFVLFFLKEKSIEQIAENQDVYYSRVIRLCKVKTKLLGGRKITLFIYRMTLVRSIWEINGVA